MTVEFTIGDVNYRTRHKMDARQQFHVARRIAPLISQIAAVGPALAVALSANNPQAMEALAEPIAKALASMSDEECDYVLDRCLALVQRQSGGNGASLWTDVWNARAGRMQFDDIQLPEMIQIATEVLRENLMGFFNTGGGPSPSPSPQISQTLTG